MRKSPPVRIPKPRHSKAFWKNAVKEWKAGGLSQRQYCAQSNLNVNTFNSWKLKLAKQPSKSRFVKVNSTEPMRSQPIDETIPEDKDSNKTVRHKINLKLLSGIELSWSSQEDPEYIGNLVKVLS